MKHSLILVAIMSGVTILIRFFPFIVFRGKREAPAFIVYLGEVLPQAIIGMLVIYCLRNINLTASPFGLPELIAVAFVVLLQAIKHNTLISVIGGTAAYMILVQLVF